MVSRWLWLEQRRQETQRAELAYRERSARPVEHRPDDGAVLDDGRVHDRSTGQWRHP